MHIRTLLNERYPLKRFVYDRVSRASEGLIVEVRHRANSKALCSLCGTACPTYDTQPPRLFEFIPILGLHTFFRYRMRRVACGACGVIVERIPWAEGKERSCKVFLAFLASWAEDLPWSRVAERFHSSWQTVCRAVEWAVAFGMEHRSLEDVSAIGVDEIQCKKGQNYLTLVYQLDQGCRRLLWIGKERTEKTLSRFFADMEQRLPGFCISLQYVCTDMWKAYLNAIAIAIPQALHVLDRFHIRGKFSEALETVRREEVRRLKTEGKEPVLARSRWCFLKNKKNLTGKQRGLLKELLGMSLKTVRAYILTEQFDHFWTYNSPAWAAIFLDTWTGHAMRSRIEPIKKVARTLRNHRELILNWFRARKEINNGITEGLNLNAKLAVRKARGFRSEDVMATALYHQMGKLPKPRFANQLW